jgi:integrase
VPYLSEDFVANKVAKLVAGKAERTFRDSKLTGFVLRVRRLADGRLAKTFFTLQPVPGQKNPRKIVIGDHATFPADKAREEAQRMLQAAKRGDDPAAERAAKKALPKWEDLVAAFRAKHLPKKKPGTAKRYNGVIDRVLTPALKGKRVADITTGMVGAFYAKRASTPADANNAMRVLSKMMTFGIGESMRSTNPCKGIERYANRTRDRWLDETELPKFLAALAKEQGPAGDLIRFLTVTGWRVSDARLLDWSQVNLKTLEVHLDDSATKKRARVLSADAAMLIDRQEGRVGAVFSRRGGNPISYEYLRERLTAVCLAAEIEPITPHTLRHSAATWGAIHGADLIELRDAFAWKSLAMPNRYVKTAQTVARRGAERVAGAINVFGKPSAEIVEAKR